MKKQEIAAVSKDATINTYAHLLHASWTLRKQAEAKPTGWYYQIMSSLILAAFTLEAFCNHVGQFLFKSWPDIERKLGPQEKLNLICERLKLTKDDGTRPYQTVHALLRFRNDVAHGKSVVMKKDFEIPMDDNYEAFLQEALQPDWQKYITMENLHRVHEDIKQIVKTIHEASKMDDIAFNLGESGYSAVSKQELDP